MSVLVFVSVRGLRARVSCRGSRPAIRARHPSTSTDTSTDTSTRTGSAGFTLLEVMAAVAILSLTLTVLIGIVTTNVRATGHARLLTTATFLARGKIVALEDGLIEKGFQDLDELDDGNFAEEGFREFSWSSAIEKIQLPTDMAKTAQQATGDLSQKKDPMQALTGMIGGLMGMFIEPVRVGLEESVRRVTVRVFWTERGRPEQSIDVIMYVTDPAKLDLALSLGGAAAGAGTSTGTGTGSKSTSSSATTGGTR